MAMINFKASVNQKGFEYYNYIVGIAFSQLQEHPEMLKKIDITSDQLRQASACKDKIKKAIIEEMKKTRGARVACLMKGE